MRLFRIAALALAPLSLAACQQDEPVTPEPANTDVSGGELIAVPEGEANPEGVTLPETTMTPVAPSAGASPAAE